MNYFYFSCVVLEFMASVVLSQELCPVKVLNFNDNFNVNKRFERIKIDVNNMLTAKHTHTERDGDERYTYTIFLCGKDIAVNQESEKANDKKIIARHTNYSLLLGGEDWLFLQYFHGDTYQAANHCHGKERQAWMTIRCEDQGKPPTLRVIEEARYDTKTKHPNTLCYYFFEYNHKYACSDDILKKLEAKNKLSGGAIFIIIFLALLLSYFLFGFLYQRFVAGAKGFEQIPNFSFWKKLGNLSADGCDFVCRREDHPNTYKGMADALDIDSSDGEDRDDGLLPM